MRKFLALLLVPLLGAAEAPTMINYQGRVRVAGADFNGTGQFKFALVNEAGTTSIWSNDGSSVSGSQPSMAVPLPVTRGIFSVKLGDSSIANMLALAPPIFNRDDLRLRVWFNDGVKGFQQLVPDQRLASVPYALNSSTIDGLDASKLALSADLNAKEENLVSAMTAQRTSLQAQITGLDLREASSTARLDSKDTDLQGQLNAATTQVQASLAQQASQITDHSTRLNQDRADITAAQSSIAQHTTQLADHGNKLNQDRADINAAQTALAQHAAQIADHAASLQDLGVSLSSARASIVDHADQLAAHAARIGGDAKGTDLKVGGVNAVRVVKDYFDTDGNLVYSRPGVLLNFQRDATVAQWHWTGLEDGFQFGRVNSGVPASVGGYNENLGWSFAASTSIGGNATVNGEVSAASVRAQNVILGPDGPVPGLRVNTVGSLGGLMRYRNILEVWPNTNNTAAGKIDVRNLTGAPTIVLNGADGHITATRVTGLLVNTSDRNVKQNIQPIDPQEILSKVTTLPIARWSYKQDPSAAHVGPMAQDFHAAFNVGVDDKTIAAVDADGVALAAIQGLHQQLKKTQEKVRQRDETIQNLELRLAAIEKLLAKTFNTAP